MALYRAAYLLVSALFLVSFLTPLTEAREFIVGGKSNAWQIPASEEEYLNNWAAASRFQVGDSLVWTYDATKDSVLQVTRKDYVNCNKTSPIAEYKDGNTKVKLDRSGPYYFISGAEGHCEKGQKLITVVLAVRNRFLGISPAPSPVEFEGPAVAPTSKGVSLRSGFMVAFLGFIGFVMF